MENIYETEKGKLALEITNFYKVTSDYSYQGIEVKREFLRQYLERGNIFVTATDFGTGCKVTIKYYVKKYTADNDYSLTYKGWMSSNLEFECLSDPTRYFDNYDEALIQATLTFELN